MDKAEKRVYQRELMRLRYACKKAGLDEHDYTRDEMLDMAANGIIHPSGRKQVKQVRHLVLSEKPKSPAVVVTQRVRIPTPVSKPKRLPTIATDNSEIARSLQWMIETAISEFGLSKREVLERLSTHLNIPVQVLRNVLQGKEPNQAIASKFKRVVQAYNDAHKNILPAPMYLPVPENREVFPIARNQWYTRLDQLNDFNKHGRTI